MTQAPRIETDESFSEMTETEALAGRDVASLYDAWQAASLLVGLYGQDAVDHADAQKSKVSETGDLTAMRTWDLISAQVSRLLRTAPGAHLM